eukprot:m.12298 g.12298  ORF g.12298 m.12298 type:complete len:244 (-) comp4631_c0_seq1:55-786(-)
MWALTVMSEINYDIAGKGIAEDGEEGMYDLACEANAYEIPKTSDEVAIKDEENMYDVGAADELEELKETNVEENDYAMASKAQPQENYSEVKSQNVVEYEECAEGPTYGYSMTRGMTLEQDLEGYDIINGALAGLEEDNYYRRDSYEEAVGHKEAVVPSTPCPQLPTSSNERKTSSRTLGRFRGMLSRSSRHQPCLEITDEQTLSPLSSPEPLDGILEEDSLMGSHNLCSVQVTDEDDDKYDV